MSAVPVILVAAWAAVMVCGIAFFLLLRLIAIPWFALLKWLDERDSRRPARVVDPELQRRIQEAKMQQPEGYWS